MFDERADKALAGMGAWMKYNGRSIYGCTEAPADIKTPANSILTYNPKLKRLYVHLLDYPLQNLRLPGYKGKVKYAQLLHDASELRITEPRGHNRGGDVDSANDLVVSLPVLKPNDEIPVIELFLN
jgi:alpha-L-fucosidase